MNGPVMGEVSLKAQFDERCYYRWAEPNSEITIFLRSEAMDRLQLQALGSMDSSRPAGMEVGGILRGWTEWEQTRLQIVVEDFETIPGTAGNSPFYSLTAKSSQNLELALKRPSPMHSAVGYFRSHNRNGLFLSPNDLELIERHFTAPENVFVLIKTLPSRACTAGFFFRKEGRIQSEFTDSEVPLIPVAAAGQFAGTNRNQNENPAITAYNERKTRRMDRRLVYGALLAGVALVGLTVAAYYEAPHQPGTHRPDLPAAPALVQRPSAAVNPAPAAPSPEPAPTAPRRLETGSEQKVRQTAVAVRSESKKSVSDTPTRLPEPVAPSLPHATEVPARSALAAAGSNAPPSAKPMPEPPDVRPLTTAASLPEPPVASAPAAAIAPLPVSALPPAPLPSAPPAMPKSSESAAAPPARTFMGARVIHQVAPAVPHEVRSRITTDVQLDIEVTISAGGKVTAARVLSAKGAAAGLLTIEALKAAQLFRFQPAQENGRNVPSVTVLTFRFDATANSNKE